MGEGTYKAVELVRLATAAGHAVGVMPQPTLSVPAAWGASARAFLRLRSAGCDVVADADFSVVEYIGA